ncbi:hypothetical protein Lsan_3541 [Legionella santicrucis]|uniref:Uncharacterized protein n=1 Tax=Legionella santicrucis TaxID=45074 RepID=A0A0W0Y854_9GAMM|nr:hypothetical protein [Legionella santicrucis]KTD53131.1 hypothetical protein Lsan_3541 [Legionella santicrucis]
MKNPTKIVVFDVDGPINSAGTTPNIFPGHNRSPELDLGDDPKDFCVPNKNFLKLTLDILYQNNILPVIGSQRIQMEDNDPFYGNYVTTMYQALNHFLGSKRSYLGEDIAREIGKQLREHNTGESKNSILELYGKKFNIAPDSIILIDDNAGYKEPAEAAHYKFVHAPRRAETNSAEDNAYLYETLLRTIPAEKVLNSLKKSNESQEVKDEFEKQLLDVFSNNQNLQIHQIQVLSQETIAKEILKDIQKDIIHTKWNSNFFSAVKVSSTNGHHNTIPKEMNKILKEIKNAQDLKQTWDTALTNVQNIINESADKKEHMCMNRKGETPKDFYQNTRAMLQNLRNSESKPELVDDESLKVTL